MAQKPLKHGVARRSRGPKVGRHVAAAGYAVGRPWKEPGKAAPRGAHAFEACADGALVIYATMPDGDGEPIRIDPHQVMAVLGFVRMRRRARQGAEHTMTAVTGNVAERYVCAHCNARPTRGDYMVHDAVWVKAGMRRQGFLCLGCLENRLMVRGHGQLKLADFIDAPCNAALRFGYVMALRGTL